MAGALALAYFLGLYWYRRHGLVRPVDFSPPSHGTERDKEAWKLVEARAEAAKTLTPDQMSTLRLYLDTAQEMALELARVYHPKAQNPIGSLTVIEVLAVIELATHDLAQLVDRYVPAGHLLTLDHWRKAQKVADYYPAASKVYWLASGLLSPIKTGARYLASEFGLARPWQMIQDSVLVWFYTTFVQRVGHYLIELNSGRLRVGATRYREMLRGAAGDVDAEVTAPQVAIAVLGQVKSGKSSVINALLGEQRAHADVLPSTDAVTRYELQLEDVSSRLILLDTPGYGHMGPKEDQLKATLEAARRSDLLLLVLHAKNPGRQSDLEVLQALERFFRDKPDLKMPVVVAALTHIDLLSPALEWDPPYDWHQPVRLKEQQIAEAVAAVTAQLGPRISYVAPVCSAEGKVYGVEEWLLPALVSLLDEAHGVALVRGLRAETESGRVRKVFRQLLEAGKHALHMIRDQHQATGRQSP
jgi:predicted GTPase